MLASRQREAHLKALRCAQQLHVVSLSSTVRDSPFDVLVNAALDTLSELILDKAELVFPERIHQFDTLIMHLQVMVVTGSTLPVGVCGHRLIACIMPVQLKDLDAGEEGMDQLEELLYALAAYQRLSRYGPLALRQAYHGTCAELQTLCADAASRHASRSHPELRMMLEARTYSGNPNAGGGDLEAAEAAATAFPSGDSDDIMAPLGPEVDDVLMTAVHLDARELLGSPVASTYTGMEMWKAQHVVACGPASDEDLSRIHDLVRTGRLPDWCLRCVHPAYEGFEHLVRKPSNLMHVPMILLVLDLYQACAATAAAIAFRHVAWIRCLVLVLAIASSVDSLETKIGGLKRRLQSRAATPPTCIFYHTHIRTSIAAVGCVELLVRAFGLSEHVLATVASTLEVLMIMSLVRFFLAHAATVGFLGVVRRSLPAMLCAMGLLLLLTLAANISMASTLLPTIEGVGNLIHGAGGSSAADALLFLYRLSAVVICISAIIAAARDDGVEAESRSVPMATRTKSNYRYMHYARHGVIPGPLGIAFGLLKFVIGRTACRLLLNAIIAATVVPMLALPWSLIVAYSTGGIVIHQMILLARGRVDTMFPYIQPYASNPRLLNAALLLTLLLHIPLALLAPLYVSIAYVVTG